MQRSPWQRFWSHIELDASSCWLWRGTTVRGGYGQFVIGATRIYAHRFAYELAYGEIPEGLDVIHSCDTPACVNPVHLRAGTHKENMADMAAKGRRNGPSRERMWQLTQPWKIKRGEEVASAKLTAEIVTAIRDDYDLREQFGETLTAIAKRYGISVEHAHAIVHRKLWKHIP